MHPDTPLLRQIHPSFVQLGRPTSQAFRPTPKDEFQLSVDDGSRIDAQACWERFTSNANFRSAGVMAIAFSECSAQELPVIEDGIPFPEHCSIDFSNLTEGSIRRKAKVLTQLAMNRGWMFVAIR